MNKKEAIAVLERAGFKFLGFNDIGWGEKFYVFENPETEQYVGESYTTLTLNRLRKLARHLDHKMWWEARRAELEAGIQQELFADWEIEENYAIVN